jgi:hypothetical protein
MLTPLEAQVARIVAQLPGVEADFIREVATAMGAEAHDIDIVNAVEEHLEEMAEG